MIKFRHTSPLSEAVWPSFERHGFPTAALKPVAWHTLARDALLHLDVRHVRVRRLPAQQRHSRATAEETIQAIVGAVGVAHQAPGVPGVHKKAILQQGPA